MSEMWNDEAARQDAAASRARAEQAGWSRQSDAASAGMSARAAARAAARAEQHEANAARCRANAAASE